MTSNLVAVSQDNFNITYYFENTAKAKEFATLYEEHFQSAIRTIRDWYQSSVGKPRETYSLKFVIQSVEFTMGFLFHFENGDMVDCLFQWADEPPYSIQNSFKSINRSFGMKNYTEALVAKLWAYVTEKLTIPSYNKLVRDNIPSVLKDKQMYVEYHPTEHTDEFRGYLYLKLEEEAYEIFEVLHPETEDAPEVERFIEEAADVLSVLQAIAKEMNIDWMKIEEAQKKKDLEKGVFDNRYILTWALE